MPKFDTELHPILAPVNKVVSRAALVKVSPDEIKKLADQLDIGGTEPHWLTSAPSPVGRVLESLDLQIKIFFLTVFHSAGFSYWGTPKWTVKDGDTTYDGTMAWLILLVRNLALLDPTFLANLTAAQWAKLTAGTGSVEMPMAAERLAILQELGKRWPEIRQTTYASATTGSAALDLVFLISRQLPGFDDHAAYCGLDILFLKRAQLLVCDWHHVISAAGLAPLAHMEQLTAFADYKIPQFLREKNVLQYGQSLANKVDNKIEIVPLSKEEIEIRAATIYAVEFLKETLAAKGVKITASDLDNRLWLAAQQLPANRVRPYHRCRTIYY